MSKLSDPKKFDELFYPILERVRYCTGLKRGRPGVRRDSRGAQIKKTRTLVVKFHDDVVKRNIAGCVQSVVTAEV